ncbi:G-type lectin S-receptor-like serine/threonine-protein kinase LECRK3 [Cornus florida]|uniref:G-type lectin S-receptor-like serine/threonine-protein kinase LECRK3 n=1 Tax=Cornus florida TaxID=4283 RepID=UPI0028A0E82E|nr:G-type lectin S-receptor-like serine/threonine-protein kinase LECRK3 [Cornus florida]
MACPLPHVLFFLFLLPFSGVAQTNGGNVSIGASLSAAAEADSWLSQSGDFAFGFKEQGRTNLFLLSIWYDKIPEKTVVWYANKGNTVPRGSKVELTADRGLVLTNPQGDEIWKSDPLVGSVAYGYMNNTGNFVLKDRNLQELWESFRVPTDTMLPTQELEKGYVLTTRKTETSFSEGRFQLSMLDNGNLVLRTINLPTDYPNEPYFTSGTQDDNDASNAGSRFVFNQSGYLYVLRANGQKSMISQGGIVSATDNYLRATLNFDGVFTEYYHPKTSNGNESWSVLWSEPENICTAIREFAGSGTCGYNSLCELKTDGRPSCSCPRGYSLLDPSDQFNGCKPNFAQGCEDDHEELYDLVELSNTDWPLSDYVLLQPFDKEECRNSCLRDCLCSVSIYRDNNCWKKRMPLSNGRVVRTESSTAFVKVRKDINSSPPGPCPPDEKKPGKKYDRTKVVVGSVLLGSSVFFNFVLMTAILLGFCFIYKRKDTRIPQVESVVDTNLRCFTYQELAQATNGFNEEVGKGALSVVYKGEMNRGSGNFVAVKKLERLVQGEKEFKAEVNVIGQTHHKNLVRLIGFCNEGPNRLLVYEYMSNGTLASFLFGDTRPSWNQRIRIAYGIGRGLLYLHEECSTQIIHCDIKPQNILIDDYYNARISDFGLAKLLMIGQSQTHTDIRGTRGYVAPEWFRSMPITVKVDVYSFGVLLLEIICCRRSVDMDTSEVEKAILTDWAYDCYQEGTIDALVEGDVEAINDRAKLERFVMVAIWCIQEDPSLRPSMRKVTQMLEGVVEVNVPPCPSPFSTTILI